MVFSFFYFARFFGASDSLTGTVSNAGDLSNVKVMGGMSNDARKTLGKFANLDECVALVRCHIRKAPACLVTPMPI